ncbi:MAG: hypothetical protein J6X59_01910 [Bacteroidales bacterium]|nr:hypothetical protein [Bacteroidales bacterium]
MKKQLQRLLLALVLLLAPAIAHAQMLGVEDITPVYDLVKTFKSLIPYRDTANHFTVTHVFMSTDYRYIKLSIAYDSDQVINEQTQSDMLDYLVHHDQWSLQPLADHTFDLRLNLFIKGKAHSAQYNYTTADLQEALNPPSFEQQARNFMAQVARSVSEMLPRQINDNGETLVACYYDSAALIFTTVYKYPNALWPEIKDTILAKMDYLRQRHAMNLLDESSGGIGEAAYIGGVTIRYRYRDHSRTDSTELLIAPWMWETYLSELSSDDVSLMDDMTLLGYIAENVNKDCPEAVDSLTTLASCVLDSVNRVMTYTYQVDELAMLNIETGTDSQNQLTANIEHNLRTNPEARMVLQLLVSTEVTLVYLYSSPHSRNPVTITFTPQQLAGFMEE